MTSEDRGEYPADAYSPNGVLWWQLKTHPGKKTRYGDELKLCAWLQFNTEVGSVVTMRELRAALGSKVVPNDAEHLNRRFRKLRQRDNGVLPSNKDDASLSVGVYRVDAKGWHPGLGTPRAPEKKISQSVRRRILERDGSRCAVCGVGNGEEYPNEPGSKAAMTIGHIVAVDHGGSSADLNNLRTECKRCNEPVRQEIRRPETLQEVLPDIRKLPREDKRKLLSWLRSGQRTRDRLDVVYDRARFLSPDERNELLVLLTRMSGATPPSVGAVS